MIFYAILSSESKIEIIYINYLQNLYIYKYIIYIFYIYIITYFISAF